MLLRVVVDVIISLCLFRVKRARVLCAARAQKRKQIMREMLRVRWITIVAHHHVGDEAKKNQGPEVELTQE